MIEPEATKPHSSSHKNDTVQVVFLLLVVITIFSIFFFTPSLRPSTLLTLINVLILAPVVHFFEKKKMPRPFAIMLVFFIFGIVLAFGLTYATRMISSQWQNLSDSLPQFEILFDQKMQLLQEWVKDNLFIDLNLGITPSLKNFGAQTQNWLINNVPSLLGSLASAVFLVPIFSFFLLKDGDRMKADLFKLVPQKYFKATDLVVTKISTALSEFLRAKLIEAFAVGLLTLIGLTLVGAPYASIFALIAGVTNIIPYLGPIMGAVPALIFIGFSNSFTHFFWPVAIVFGVVNAIDLAIIFPIFVAKLVNLSPLTLLTAVAVGQEFYGLIGMLIAVPIASILKIIYQVLVHTIYPQ